MKCFGGTRWVVRLSSCVWAPRESAGWARSHALDRHWNHFTRAYWFSRRLIQWYHFNISYHEMIYCTSDRLSPLARYFIRGPCSFVALIAQRATDAICELQVLARTTCRGFRSNSLIENTIRMCPTKNFRWIWNLRPWFCSDPFESLNNYDVSLPGSFISNFWSHHQHWQIVFYKAAMNYEVN